jgi:hypothetical protein
MGCFVCRLQPLQPHSTASRSGLHGFQCERPPLASLAVRLPVIVRLHCKR